jgi:glutamyl-tRNA synthetase
MLSQASEALSAADWTAEGVEAAIRDAGRAVGFVNDEGNVQLSKAQAPVRVALTGKRVGLPLWESVVTLGRERALARLAAAQERLGAPEGD